MQDLKELWTNYWPHIFFVVSFVASTVAAIHAAMTKHDVRAAIGWVGIIIFSPLFGAVFYLVAGINRIRPTRRGLVREGNLLQEARSQHGDCIDVVPHSAPQFASLQKLGDRVGGFNVTAGNQVTLLDGGDATYTAMLDAINAAKCSIALQSYIFDNDPVGRKIANALIEAQRRGVTVRVLIDAVGANYSLPPIVSTLHRAGVPTARFNASPWLFWRMPYANLRSHRKVLVVDGRIGFTGGMNIRVRFTQTNKAPSRDTHFRFEGPVVQQLMAVFAHDWDFTTQESLAGATWFEPDLNHAPGDTPVRCILTGPDRYIGSTHKMLLGALAVAQHHVRIQSPYFLPDQPLIGALATAARRGVRVDIVVPGKNNLRMVDYAMTAQLDQIIRTGCRVWRARGTFDHSKLMTVDGAWSYIGSSNLDPRSLRLNFELDSEIYDRAMAQALSARMDQAINEGTRVTLRSLYRLPFIKRLRNKLIWLASPYL